MRRMTLFPGMLSRRVYEMIAVIIGLMVTSFCIVSSFIICYADYLKDSYGFNLEMSQKIFFFVFFSLFFGILVFAFFLVWRKKINSILEKIDSKCLDIINGGPVSVVEAEEGDEDIFALQMVFNRIINNYFFRRTQIIWLLKKIYWKIDSLQTPPSPEALKEIEDLCKD